jgi:N-acetylglucosamine-6-phosphate deacetylase
VPAGVLGLTDVGRLTPGGPADVVGLDDDLEVVRALVGGEERVAG